jgi:hypothetical protein
MRQATSAPDLVCLRLQSAFVARLSPIGTLGRQQQATSSRSPVGEALRLPLHATHLLKGLLNRARFGDLRAANAHHRCPRTCGVQQEAR